MDGAMDGAVRNERMLLKIAAILVSLSLIAERAAGRSFPVRFLLLAILRRAEVIARAFVVRETQIDWPEVGETSGMYGHPADAASLALRLRMLAVILADFVEAACLSAGDEPFASVAPRGVAQFLLFIVPGPRRRGFMRNQPWDTS